MEIEDPHNEGLVQYNVTFEHLMRRVRERGISGPSVNSEIEYGLGSYYPTPGGLAENVRWFLGDQVFIRQIEGERHLYQWLHQNASRIEKNETPFLFIDALNCEKGCICGTAVNPEKSETDDALYALLKIREESKKEHGGDAWSRPDPPEERLKNYNKQFASLDLNDYLRGYTDRSSGCTYEIPDEESLDKIFRSMNKMTEEERSINCTCCGYESCRMMATAIHNGFNHKENCIFYEKTMVHRLEAEKLLAEEVARAKSEFLSNMSHEIRTPINAVLGMNELILRETGEQKTREYAENIKRSGSLLLSLINDVLDYARIDSGKMELVLGEYAPAELINDVENMIRPVAEEKSLTLTVTVDPEIPRSLYGDAARIRQCLINLLTNAVKYTDKGSVSLSLKLLHITHDTAEIGFTVTDTGVGMKPEHLDRLFVAFERSDRKHDRSIGGSGLGMNIVQSVLKLMDSTITVESEFGKGSVFSFTLKQKHLTREKIGDHESADSAAGEDHALYQRSFTAPSAEILLVDDTPMNLVVVQSLLKDTHVNIDAVGSAGEAMEFLDAKIYDLLLFDHMMPEMDGVQLLAWLKKQDKNPNCQKPCIVLTANAVAGARQEYLQLGFDDYMSKPVDGAALEALLIHYLPKDKVQLAEAEQKTASAEVSDVAKWYERLSGIDVEAGIHNCGSDESYRSILQIFYEAIRTQSQELDGYFASEDWENYTIKVHALKSSSRIVGATELSELAFRLETAGKSDDIDYIRKHHKKLITDYLAYRKILKPVCGSDDEKKPDEADVIDETAAGELFLSIAEAAEVMDYGALEAAFAEADRHAFPASLQTAYDAAKKCFMILDYDGILAAVRR
ncbi:MAG: response regulator [Lachnospiraceae bacterium]|nr:response regulator [Lachnospiraceae bacterium]